MNILMSNIKNELIKLKARKKYIVFMIIGLLICIGNSLIPAVMSFISRGHIKLTTSNLFLSVFPFFSEIIVPLLIFMSVTDLFTTEQADGALKGLITRPISRLKIFISKVSASVIYIVIIYMGIILTGSVVICYLTGGTIDIVSSISAYLLMIFPLAILALMTALICQLTKSSTLVMLLCILVYMGLRTASIFNSYFEANVFTSYISWYKQWIGVSLPVLKLATSTGILIGYATVFFSAGYILFEKKEF